MDDPVIARADGSALYNFAVAVDDLDAGITHVVRGEDHLSNTPKQLLVFEALGAPPPRYAHLPLLHGPDGTQAVQAPRRGLGAGAARQRATCPRRSTTTSRCSAPASPPTRSTSACPELAERFRLERVSKNPAVFDERKLRHMNGR